MSLSKHFLCNYSGCQVHGSWESFQSVEKSFIIEIEQQLSCQNSQGAKINFSLNFICLRSTRNKENEQMEYEKKLTHFLCNFLPLYGKVLHIFEYGVMF
jgi:hypothetical protein